VEAEAAAAEGVEVAAAVEAVGRDPRRHSLAARRLAEEYFAGRIVLGGLVDAVGL
jgi:hypothetical protein